MMITLGSEEGLAKLAKAIEDRGWAWIFERVAFDNGGNSKLSEWKGCMTLHFEAEDYAGRCYAASADFPLDGPVDALLAAMDQHYPLPTVRWAVAEVDKAAKLRGWRRIYVENAAPMWKDANGNVTIMFQPNGNVTLVTYAKGAPRNPEGDIRAYDFPSDAPVTDLIALLDEHYPIFDLVSHLERQRQFSERTFGPGARTAGVCDHIRKELKEIEEAPADLEEWIDVVMLALDGAWRTGASSSAIAAALAAKLAKNEARTWPDWRTAEPGKAIEHVR